jgi:hypothetical protein
MVRYLLLVIVAGFAGASLARPKGRSQVLWFLLCAIVPLLVIVIALLPPVESPGYTKRCPHCSEISKESAVVCKYCGLSF